MLDVAALQNLVSEHENDERYYPVKQLILDKSNKKTKYNLDSHMKESLDELEKKLQFIKY